MSIQNIYNDIVGRLYTVTSCLCGLQMNATETDLKSSIRHSTKKLNMVNGWNPCFIKFP